MPNCVSNVKCITRLPNYNTYVNTQFTYDITKTDGLLITPASTQSLRISTSMEAMANELKLLG